ncbi:Patatin-like protein [Thalictrum thalictroides]|uniref:Patatin n=1 Tax=Thalictrum thalictroides TaxID=46969 RepID=A0A7J6V587_THATH|nr:Patatin-like protein [Thalictrum thalictroides]
MGPKYDGVYLHSLQKEKLGELRLSQTLMNVAIPTFDIKRLQPTIFYTYEVKRDPTLDARLCDICIGTSAAPTYLPAYRFNNSDKKGKTREFHLVDGGVTANNPSLVALTEVTKQVENENPDFFPIKPMDYGIYLAISLGTGSPKAEKKYNADMAAKWGVLGWLTTSGSTPLIDVFTQSSGDLVYHLSVDDTLGVTESSTDIATKENLENLVKVVEKL